MVEKFLVDLFQRVKKNKIAIIISGNEVNDNLLNLLPKLRAKLKNVGELKFASVIYEGNLPESHFNYLQEAGFSHRIVPSNLTLNYLIDVYDLFLKEDFDMIILGTNDVDLIPLITEIRKKCTIYGLVRENSVSKAIAESFDGLIKIESLDDFTFEEESIPEYTIDGSYIPSTKSDQIVDLANIGITSDKISGDES